jgi:hypothetical protein
VSELELIEASANYNGLMQGWISTFFAVFTAYTIAAYMAGAKLTTKQLAFITI